jgi:hypothetical protein
MSSVLDSKVDAACAASGAAPSKEASRLSQPYHARNLLLVAIAVAPTVAVSDSVEGSFI